MGLVHAGTGSRRREFEGERKSSERLLQARERLGLAHRGVIAGGVLDGVVVRRDGADPGRERRPVQEEALVLLFGRLRPVELALDLAPRSAAAWFQSKFHGRGRSDAAGRTNSVVG